MAFLIILVVAIIFFILMDQNVRSTPRDFFMYLLSTATLYLTVASVLTLLFQFINVLFPDAANPNYGLASTVRLFVAMLVVVFPVYLWTTNFLRRERDLVPEKGEIKVRKWLVYLTIFLSAALIIGDTVTLVYKFLEGELSIRFYLKVLAVLLVAAGVFGYYFFDLRRKPGEKLKQLRTIAWSASAVAAIIAIAGFFVVGSPMKQRLIKFDTQKLQDIQTLQTGVEQYYLATSKLPDDLNVLSKAQIISLPKDPQGQNYEYTKKSDLNYELCAQFNLTSADAAKYEYTAPRYANETWDHASGRQCFERNINSDILNERYSKTVPAIPQ